MRLRSLLLTPFAALYGLALVIRHALYDARILKSTRPTVPTIAIGNLALGGTGKTPMLEHVLRVLKDVSPVATLSRGYGRTGNDMHEVQAGDTAERSGDEPLQLKTNFPAVRVFVGADRVSAIERIQLDVPEVKAVVLDDALQHRKLDAGLNILLTTWQRPWSDDALLPAGRLRDLPSRRKAAQIVVVTKCPSLPSEADQRHWRERLRLRPDQALFFSGIAYAEPSLFVGRGPNNEARTTNNDLRTTSALLFTGIADPTPLVEHVKGLFARTEHITFPDHHPFGPADLQRLADRSIKFAPGPNRLVTTEKDAMRLRSVIAGSPLEGLPVLVIGMRTIILNEPERFADLIRLHVATHPAHR